MQRTLARAQGQRRWRTDAPGHICGIVRVLPQTKIPASALAGIVAWMLLLD